jgi:DNA-binding NarL/FixJ family response regulator
MVRSPGSRRGRRWVRGVVPAVLAGLLPLVAVPAVAAKATPTQTPPQPWQAKVTTGLLASGMKDEAIAHHLGWSHRTTRRRIATLMASLNADTRFQAGLYAARQAGCDRRSTLESFTLHRPRRD